MINFQIFRSVYLEKILKNLSRWRDNQRKLFRKRKAPSQFARLKGVDLIAILAIAAAKAATIKAN